MRAFDDNINLVGIGNKVLSGKPIVFIPEDVNTNMTLREPLSVGSDSFWIDKSNALQLYDSIGNLFSIALTSVDLIDTVIAKRGLQTYDSTPLTSTLVEYNLIVDEDIITKGYDWSINRTFGMELSSITEMIGLRMKVKLNDQSFIPAKWHSSPAGNFTTYYSADNVNWTKIVDYTINSVDDEERWFSDSEAYYCYLDFWFDEVINAKYFKIFASHTFLMADIGNTLTDTFEVVELLGYPLNQGSLYSSSFYNDGIKEGDISNYFSDPDVPESFYGTLSTGHTNYSGSCSLCDSSSLDQYEFRAVECIKNYAVSDIDIYFYLNDISEMEMDDSIIGWDGGMNPEIAIFGSNDNIHWTLIQSGISISIQGDNQCGYCDVALSSSVVFRYIGFEITNPGSHGDVEWWDYSQQMSEVTTGYFSGIRVNYS